MPIVRVDLYQGFSSEYRQQILDSVHEALVFAFRIPEGDRNQLIREHADDALERSEGKSRQFVIVELTVFRGRSREAKRALYRRLVDNLGQRPGIPASDVLIVLHEPELVNWGVSGGVPADETQLGFRIDV